MCTISLTPLSLAARLASRGISMPMISSAGDTMRALIPWMSPRCWSTTFRVSSRLMLDSAMMSGSVASPVWQMCRNGITSVWQLGGGCRGRRGEPGLAGVQELDPRGVAARDDVSREPAEGGRPRAARVHDGGHARVDAAQVRVRPGAVEALEDGGGRVDEPRDRRLAAPVDGARGLGLRDLRRDADDGPPL